MIFNFVHEGRSYPIHYELSGTGSPVLILNGIMMATTGWHPFVKTIQDRHQLLLVDFIDQGQSASCEMTYSQGLQVAMLAALLQELKLGPVRVYGISYGGQIALALALEHPELVHALILANSSTYTPPWFRAIAASWFLAAGEGEAFYQASIPLIYGHAFWAREQAFLAEHRPRLIALFNDQDFMARLKRLIESTQDFDCRQALHRLHCPCLVVASEQDTLIPKAFQEEMAAAIEGAHFVSLPGQGHASMYENPVLFQTLVLGFFGQC